MRLLPTLCNPKRSYIKEEKGERKKSKREVYGRSGEKKRKEKKIGTGVAGIFLATVECHGGGELWGVNGGKGRDPHFWP